MLLDDPSDGRPADQPTCQLVTVGLGDYDAEPTWSLPAAKESRESVAQLLSRYGAEVEDWTLHATTERLRGALGKWSTRTEKPQILYWVGHGEHSDNGYFAALADSTDPLDGLNSLDVPQLFAAIRNQHLRRATNEPSASWTLLILDTCGSGPGVSSLRSLLELERHKIGLSNVGVIATTGSGAAFAGSFPEALKLKLKGFTGNDTGGIKLKELLRRLEDLWETPDDPGGPVVMNLFTATAVLPLPAGLDQPVQAPVDTYAELSKVLDRTTPAIRNHFYAKAQGAEIGEPAWHFTGRESERRTITAWLRDATGGMFVVSGVAGSGKSALLGMLLASSDPDVRGALVAAGQAEIPPDLRPDDQAFQAVVHLSGRTITETVTMLTDCLELSDTAGDQDALVEQINNHANRDNTVTVLADALDEARDPLPIAVLFRRIARIDGVRLLVGTRQSLKEGPDQPIPPDSLVLDTLSADQVIKLPRDPDAVHSYTRDRLTAKLPPDLHHRIDHLAQLISGYEQPFLFARLAVHEITAAPDWAAPDVDLNRLLGAGHTGIFKHTVERLRRDTLQVEALLHALAYARGNGLPRDDGIWATVAAAITHHPIIDTDIDQALNVAAPYILLDTEHGQTVYRLAHRTFAEWYRKADTP